MMRGNQTSFYHQTWFVVNKDWMTGAVKLLVVSDTPIQLSTYCQAQAPAELSYISASAPPTTPPTTVGQNHGAQYLK